MQVTRLDDHQEDVIQALAATAKLGGYAIKKASTSDDLEKVILTVSFTAISAGFKQSNFDFEREDLTVVVDGTNGHVDRIGGLQPGDLAETGAQAEEEIAALAGQIEGVITEPETITAGQTPPAAELDPSPDIHLVGEAAAVARPRKRR